MERFWCGVFSRSKSSLAMKTAILLLSLVLLPNLLFAVGTKKKRLKIYVRRELAPPAECRPPVEIHQAVENFHALQCKTSGVRCPWRYPPRLSTRRYTLATIEAQVVRFLSNQSISQGTWEIGGLGIYYRRLPTGYEYHIVEGGDTNEELDALIIAAQLRESGGRRVRATVNGKPWDD